ncbi:haloacid dehalogenase-like hydrolase [Kribbella sp. NPDC050124]|uniref:haloacid dehalogenase-like hydrolase n=1 Tax=Kribbella sp. NPDC050124 TaxID=3364114 RepID=UPI00379A452F
MAVFDLDGVLSRRDTFTEFVRLSVVRGPWRLPLLLPVPLLLAMCPVLEWRRHIAHYGARISLLGRALTDVERELQRLGGHLAKQPDWPMGTAVERVGEHLAAGDRVIVVTATEANLARSYLDALGLQKAELLASRLREARLGLSLRPHNHGREKARQLAQLVPPPWHVVYTDSLSDLPLMRATREVRMVNVRRTAVRAARRKSGVRTIVEQWR